MVSRMGWITVLLLVLGVALLPAVGFAAEHGGQEHGGKTETPAAPAKTEAPAAAVATAPAAPAVPETPAVAPAPIPVTPPALKPIVITFSGEVASVDTQAAPASLTVKDRYGVTKEIAVPSEAKISKGTEAKTAADLQVGDKLTVEYTYDVATGKRTAQNITLGEAASAPATR